MPCWYFDQSELQSSPSNIIHQKQGIALIILISDILKIPYDVYETAGVYFHRTFISYSYLELHRHVVSLTCLNIACKYLDANIKLEDIIKSAKSILTEIQFEALGSDILAEIMLTEKIVLCALKFDLEIDHAYPYVIKMAKLLKVDPVTIDKLVYMTWTFINDQLYSTLSVQYEPEVLAVSLFYLACRLSRFEITEWEGMPSDSTKKWYEFFVPGVNIKIIKDICYKVLELYHKDSSSDDENIKEDYDNENHQLSTNNDEHPSRSDIKSPSRKRYYSISSSSSDTFAKHKNHRHHSKEHKKHRRHRHKFHRSKEDNSKKLWPKEGEDAGKSLEENRNIDNLNSNTNSNLIAYRPLSENAKSAILSLIVRRSNNYQVTPIFPAYPAFKSSQPFFNNYPYPYDQYYGMM